MSQKATSNAVKEVILSQKARLLTLFNEDIGVAEATELLDIFSRQCYLQGFGDAIDIIATFDPSGKPLHVLLEEKLQTNS